ncbi:MAG: GyrI-like domain-containing protein [Mycobacteriaceae bacterium]
MSSYDIKQQHQDLYGPKPGNFTLVDVPPLGFLMIDGHGDPNTAPAYREAVEALFSTSYAVRSVARATLARVHTVGPLEGLWSAVDLDTFRTRDKAAWDWTMMIVQPEWVTADLVADGLAAARRKRLPALAHLRFESFTEGRSAQILHVGPYDAEAPTIDRLHREFLPTHGLVPVGRHHEIYLSDPRRTEPARLRTVLRQPVSTARDGARGHDVTMLDLGATSSASREARGSQVPR